MKSARRPTTPATAGHPVTRSARSRIAVPRFSLFDAVSDDICELILNHLQLKDLRDLRHVNVRWTRLVASAYPRVCRRRFSRVGDIEIPPAVLWELACMDDVDEDALRMCLSALARLETAWPGAVQTDRDGIRYRLDHLRVLKSRSQYSADTQHLSLPADAVLCMVLGVQLEGSSPIGTLTGDFGPDFDEEAHREPWRLALSWPPQLFLPPADAEHNPAADNGAFANAAANAAGAAGAHAAGAHQEVADEVNAAEAPIHAPLSASEFHAERGSHAPMHAPQFLADFIQSERESVGDVPSLESIDHEDASSLLLVGHYALSVNTHGVKLPLFLNCGTKHAPEHASDRSSGRSSGRSRGEGGLHFVVSIPEAAGMDGGPDTEYSRFPAEIDQQPVGLTRLFQLMGEMLAPLAGKAPSWAAAWREVDFWAGVLHRFDNLEDDIESSVESSIEDGSVFDETGSVETDASEALDEESEGEASGYEEGDEYPASMLGSPVVLGPGVELEV